MRMMRIRQANAIASLWAFAEATVFIIVPDVLLSWLALRSFKRGLIACLFALLGSLIGGATMWLWAKNNPDSARAIVESLPAISRAMISKRSTADCGVRTYSPLPVGDITTHYSAPDISRLLEYAERICDRDQGTVLRIVGQISGKMRRLV